MREWVIVCEQKLQHCDLKNTASEKRGMLLDKKNLEKESGVMQKSIENLEEKAKLLPTHLVTTNVKELQHKYAACCKKAKSQIETWQDYVQAHVSYNDEYNACLEWMKNKQELLNVCTESCTDKQATQHRLHKIKVNTLQSYITHGNMICLIH